MGKHILGVDVGGTKCAVLLGRSGGASENNRGLIEGKTAFATEAGKGWRDVVARLFSAADRLLAQNAAAADDIEAIGISCGGPLDSKRGVVLSPPNLPDWDGVEIARLFTERYGAPAFLQNDANACAVAEWKFGAGRGLDNMIFLTFGTGMGAGLILDGRLYSGTNDLAGEAGHIRLAESGPEGYGKAGSFEGFCSGGGLAKLAESMLAEHTAKGGRSILEAVMKREGMISAKDAAEAARLGDELAGEIYAVCGRYLGKGLAVLIDLLNPQAIIIGSIFERSGDLLRASMMESLQREALAQSLDVCEIKAAALGDEIGDYAALGIALNAIGK